MKNNNNTVTKAVIPVAGFGTRFLPVTKAMPKEMLPVVDKPVIQYIVEEAVASGITDIIFVTGRGKRAIEEHFDTSYELEQTLVEQEKRQLLNLVRELPLMARFAYVRQSFPKGDGHAILQAKPLIGKGEAVAVLFGDAIIDSKVPALTQLLRVFTRYQDAVVGLSEVPRKDLHQFGTIKGREVGPGIWEVKRFVEKPKDTREFPKPLVAHGKYILPYEVFDALEREERAVENRAGKSRRGEIRLANALASYYMKERPVYGFEVKGTWYDCGSKLGYLKANIVYARKRPELKRDLDAFLSTRRRVRPKTKGSRRK